MPICTQCQQEFFETASHPHAQCDACRVPKYPCPGCGKIIRKTSASCWDCRVEIGSSNGNWHGGKTRHSSGYPMLHVPDHPRAKSNRGYVFEHILIMEDLLGRHLKATEKIHHKNGIRDDNRPENLELWTTSHPSGCRVDDLLAWALEFLDEYAPEKLVE